jgi:hypothetical protein
MKAYYGSRFSPNLTRTPEGYLICHNVPIARTGWQEYLGRELGLDDKYDQIIRVYRDPKEVFSNETIASFEGKPAVDEHPPDDVMPDNVSSYLKGVARDIRRGTGEETDLLLADLIIYDPTLISEIENGKREVSCGYNCVYVPRNDTEYTQEQIRGNHVAIVAKGRAGDRVAIKDAAPEINEIEKPKDERSTQRMRKQFGLRTLLGMGVKQMANDAAIEPEDVMDAVEGMTNELNAAKKPEPEATPAAKPEPSAGGGGDIDSRISELESVVKDLVSVVRELVATDKQAHQEENPLDALEGELAQGASTPEAGEEAETIPAEEMHDDAGPVSEASSRPENPIPGADSAYLLSTLRAMKPAIAAITDPVARKKATDALASSIRGVMGTPSGKKQSYAEMAKPAKPQVATDSKPVDQTALGKEWAKKFNPQYKEDK